MRRAAWGEEGGSGRRNHGVVEALIGKTPRTQFVTYSSTFIAFVLSDKSRVP